MIDLVSVICDVQTQESFHLKNFSKTLFHYKKQESVM